MENKEKIKELGSIIVTTPYTDLSKVIMVGLAILVCIVEVVVVGVLVNGNYGEIQENFSEINRLTGEVVRFENGAIVLESLDKAFLASEFATAELALPSEKSVTGFVSALTNLASSSGATVNEIEISYGKVSTRSGTEVPSQAIVDVPDVKIGNSVIGVPLSLKVQANDLQTLDLIGKIQEVLPLLGIKEMTYVVSSDKTSGGLSVLIFSQPAEKFTLSKLDKIKPLTEAEIETIRGLSTKTNILR